MNTYKKPLILVLVVALVTGIGWYVLAGSGDDAEIAAITAETEQIINSRSTTTQAALDYSLQELSVSAPEEVFSRTEVFDISFATPWGAGAVTDDQGGMVALTFPGGQEVLAIHSTQGADELHNYLANFEAGFSDAETSPLELFKQELGDDFDAYTYRRYLLETTLDSVRTADTADEAQTRAYALILRAGNSVFENSDAYAFQTDQVKGFMVDGSSVQSDGAIGITFWDSDEQMYQLILHEGGTREAAEAIISTLEVSN